MTSSWTVEPLARADFDALVHLDARSFALASQLTPLAPGLFPPDQRVFGVWSNDGRIHDAPTSSKPGSTLVGAMFSIDVTAGIPGPLGAIRSTTQPGATWVSVHPLFRRRGIATALLTHHLAWCRDQGYALSSLHVSEETIYGRFGYAPSTCWVQAEFGHAPTFTWPALDDAAHAVRLEWHDDPAEQAALICEVMRATTERRLGAVAFDEATLRELVLDRPVFRSHRDEPQRLLAAYRDGHLSGICVFDRAHATSNKGARITTVRILATIDDATQLALAMAVTSLDLMDKTRIWDLSLEHGLVWAAGGPGEVVTSVGTGRWLRLVDVPAALSLRGYDATCSVVLRVEDPLCPWNTGSWRLTVDDAGHAQCEATTDDADLTVTVQALASSYLGLRSPLSQVNAGVTEHRTGAARALSRAMATHQQPMTGCSF